jgi:hypothetical protein
MVRDNPEINKRVAEMTALGGTGVPDDIGPMSASLARPQKPEWTAGQRSKVSGGMFFGDNQSNLAAQLSRLVNAASGGEQATFDRIMITRCLTLADRVAPYPSPRPWVVESHRTSS